MQLFCRLVLAVTFLDLIVDSAILAQDEPREVIPHAQDKPPGPPLSAEEAVKKMEVPEGFTVEIVAAEPMVVNPVAMTFDERGRIWVCESLEYPRREAGEGRDRVKILEDTDGDGAVDKSTIFAEGLNIPSGIAVGHGGVWVANSPDILFMQDTDGDGKADKQEVVVTGFGRDDTHELPNSFTWGPDGWLYGLNGVFNHSHVKYAKENPNYEQAGGEKQPGWQFTCAMWRIHPRTREFEIFAEGTSNPWGIAFNEDGEAFVSACVIDHLWHIVQTGYYHRQGGPYPPHTWKIDSIVDHKHQKAAYCGLEFFDSDAYPEQYRGLLYMGNIHGNCINVDRLHRDGSTYKATAEPDFLTANDAWFMPVDQKTGPDGCLYILDWYDRYHCYQDANRDPAGIDRLKGRIYRVRYKDTPRAGKFDLAKESDDELIERLGSANVFYRETAQRLLTERLVAKESPDLKAALLKIVDERTEPLPDDAPMAVRHAFWTLVGADQLPEHVMIELIEESRDSVLKPWAMRAMGEQRHIESDNVRRKLPVSRSYVTRFGGVDTSDKALVQAMRAQARAEQSRFELQLAIAARKIADADWDPILVLASTLHAGEETDDDELIPHIVWNNLKPLLDERGEDFLAVAKEQGLAKRLWFRRMLPHLSDKLLSQGSETNSVVALFSLLRENPAETAGDARHLLVKIAERIQTGELDGEQLETLKKKFDPALVAILKSDDDPLFADAAFLAVTWKNEAAIDAVREVFRSTTKQHPADLRLKALGALIAAEAEFLEHDIDEALANADAGEEFRGQLLASLGRIDRPFVSGIVLAHYESLEAHNKPKAIELLTQRTEWAKELLAAIGEKKVPAEALNANQVLRLVATDDKELDELIAKHWGAVRTERDPLREQYVDKMKFFIRRNPGDPHKGIAAFKKTCGQCHKLHGEGTDVGPDITLNGRNSFDQLLSNVFDPSLVIGAAYQARTVATQDGRILTGLLVEESDERVVLKVQGGKLETIARDDILEYGASKLSMMPEDVEKQLTQQEIADLFAYLTLDKPPGDQTATRLAGVYDIVPHETGDPAQFNKLLGEVAPGFTMAASGEGGIALLPEHRGRKIVVRTHPLDKGKGTVLTRKLAVPAAGTTKLLLSVGHHEQGDWQLLVRADGDLLHDSIIGEKTAKDGWADIEIDLTPLAGKEINLELVNQPTGWAWEHGYWGQALIETTSPDIASPP